MAATNRDLDYDGSLYIDSILSQDETKDIVTMLTMADELETGTHLPSFCTSSQMGGRNQQCRPISPPLSPVMPFKSEKLGDRTCFDKGENEQDLEMLSNSISYSHLRAELNLNQRNTSNIGDKITGDRPSFYPGTVPSPGRSDDPVGNASEFDATITAVSNECVMNEGDVKEDVVIDNAATITKAKAGVTEEPTGRWADGTAPQASDEVKINYDGETRGGDDSRDKSKDDGPDGREDPDSDSDSVLISEGEQEDEGDFSSPQGIVDKFRKVDALLLSMGDRSSTLSTTVRNLESSLEFSQNEISQLKKENEDLKEKLGSLITEDRRTQFQVNGVEDKLDRLETTTKKKNLILEGVPENEGRRENVENSVGKLFDQLSIDDRVNFEACYRVGTYRGGRVRPIHVSFERQADRDLIYSKRFDLKRTHDFQRVWINEDLGPASKKKREMIRLIAREAKLQGVDCRTGKYALHVDGTKFDHNNFEDLPPQLQPSSLKQVQLDQNTIAYQSEHAPFSNFFHSPIVVGKHTFFCVEQAFQFVKAKSLNKALMATKIFLCRDVRLIKQWGDELGTSPAWEARQFEVMYGCLKKKFLQSSHLRTLLLNTGNMILVEATPNRLWGCGATLSSNAIRKREWPGQNKHGEILMTVRDEIRCLNKE